MGVKDILGSVASWFTGSANADPAFISETPEEVSTVQPRIRPGTVKPGWLLHNREAESGYEYIQGLNGADSLVQSLSSERDWCRFATGGPDTNIARFGEQTSPEFKALVLACEDDETFENPSPADLWPEQIDGGLGRSTQSMDLRKMAQIAAAMPVLGQDAAKSRIRIHFTRKTDAQGRDIMEATSGQWKATFPVAARFDKTQPTRVSMGSPPGWRESVDSIRFSPPQRRGQENWEFNPSDERKAKGR